jgi:L,D-peptidoglycan transpeptidase YkuD (ErfK/YbiS/YcfS/YnhG family)
MPGGPGRRPWSRRLRRLLLVAAVLVAVVGASGPALARLAPGTAEPETISSAGRLLTAAQPVVAEPVARRPGVGAVPRPTAAAPGPPASTADAVTPTPAAAPPRVQPPDGTGPPSAPPTEVAAPRQQALPLDLSPPGSQVVTVVAPSSSATRAQLTAWQLGADGGWTAVLGPVAARVGSAGIGRASETSTRTPAGTFGLTEAFGRAGDPGTALPYRVVDGDDWWVSDPASPRYNRYARCAPGSCDFDEAAGEDLAAAGPVYDHAVVIDYNRGGTPGAGSAFFLHVSDGAPTAGCVAVDRSTLRSLLRWLDPAATPVIAIGVG